MEDHVGYVDPSDCVVAITFFTVITTVAVGLRLYARIWVTKTVAWDDSWLVCSQALLLVVNAVFAAIACIWNQAGRSMDSVSNDRLNSVSRCPIIRCSSNTVAVTDENIANTDCPRGIQYWFGLSQGLARHLLPQACTTAMAAASHHY